MARLSEKQKRILEMIAASCMPVRVNPLEEPRELPFYGSGEL